MTTLTYFTSVIFLMIAILHALWGIGVSWPAANETALARMVVGAPGITQMPPLAACLFVTICLLIGMAIVLRLGGVLILPMFPYWFIRLAGAGVALVFLARGIVGFLPFWAEITPEEPFRHLDKRYFSPLCIGLGLAVATLVIQSKSIASGALE